MGHSPVGLQSVRRRFPHTHRDEILPSPCSARLDTASPTLEADESHWELPYRPVPFAAGVLPCSSSARQKGQKADGYYSPEAVSLTRSTLQPATFCSHIDDCRTQCDIGRILNKYISCGRMALPGTASPSASSPSCFLIRRRRNLPRNKPPTVLDTFHQEQKKKNTCWHHFPPLKYLK